MGIVSTFTASVSCSSAIAMTKHAYANMCVHKRCGVHPARVSCQMVTILHVIRYPKLPEVLIVMMIIIIKSILIKVSNEHRLKSASKFPKVPEVLIVMMIIVTMSLLIIVSNRQ